MVSSFSTDVIATSDVTSVPPGAGGGDLSEVDLRNHRRQTRARGGSTQKKVRIKKFCNGVPVPVFYPSSDNEESKPQHSSSECSIKKEEEIEEQKLDKKDEIIQMLITCPICTDYMVEATSSHCGHIFCSCCLDQWIKVKPICPICGSEVKSRHRLYNLDLFIEHVTTAWGKYTKDVRLRLDAASKTRIELLATTKPSFYARFREKLSRFVLSLRCKGLCHMIRNSSLSQTISRNWAERQIPSVEVDQLYPHAAPVKAKKTFTWIKFGFTLMLGAFLLWSLQQFGETNFGRYCYLSWKNYNGEIPEYLKSSEGSVVSYQEYCKNLNSAFIANSASANYKGFFSRLFY